MKKLLSIISSICLISAGTLNTVACDDSNTRISNPSLADKIKKYINFEIHNGDWKGSIYGQYKNENIWNNPEIEKKLNSFILGLINKWIGLSFNQKIYNDRAKQININIKDEDKIDKIFNDEVNNIAKSQLYTTYIKDKNNFTYLENKISKASSGSYSPDIQSGDWYVPGTYSAFMKDATAVSEDYDPEKSHWKDDYNPNDPVYDANKVMDYYNLNPKLANFEYWNKNFGKGKESTEKLQEDLTKRFKTYLKNEITLPIYDKMLSIIYLKMQKYSVDPNTKNPYINIFSPFFQNWQNWDFTNKDWSSNIKMVWQYNFPNYFDLEDLSKDIKDKLNKETNINKIDDVFKEKTGIIQLIDEYREGKGEKPHTRGDDSLGSDPIFGKDGYEGIFGYDPNNASPTIITPNSNNDDLKPYLNELAKLKKPGLLRDRGNPLLHNRSNNNSETSIIFSIPIYPLDIYGNENDLIKFIPIDDIKDKKNKISTTYYGGGIYNNVDFKNVWNRFSNYKKHSSDIEALKGYARTKLLNLIESTIASEKTKTTSIGDQAKTAFYSFVFDYNPDNILTQNLFDQIGKYVQKY